MSESSETGVEAAQEKSKDETSSEEVAQEFREDAKRRAELDSRTLFIKNLPADTTEEQVRALSEDIIEVRFRKTFRKKGRGYAFIDFASEAVAEKNHKTLTGQKIGENEIVVDYVGLKSQGGKSKAGPPAEIDPRKLYVAGLSSRTTEEQLKELFPTSNSIYFPMHKKTTPVGFAFIFYETEEAAKLAHESMLDTEHDGRKLIVLFGKKAAPRPRRTGGPPSKKQKKNDGEAADAGEKDGDSDTEEQEEPKENNDSPADVKVENGDDSK